MTGTRRKLLSAMLVAIMVLQTTMPVVFLIIKRTEHEKLQIILTSLHRMDIYGKKVGI